jgi:nitroimidazol reductase NimA-like FMN-containing flavoprotein (pyridoxamine 5'-phosphate oxidase superfamily)
MPVRTWHVDIPVEECRERLAASVLGRLGVVVDGRPEIFPVNHVFDANDDSVAFPTNDGTKLHAAVNWPSVAFEVDGIEPGGGGGWSVIVVGKAEEVLDIEEVERLASQRTVLWAAGRANRWVRIVPTKITGRRIWADEI